MTVLQNQGEAYNAEVANPQQDQGSQAYEAEGSTYQEQPNQEQRPSSEDQERNWRALRQKAEEAERRAEAAERQSGEYSNLLKGFMENNKKPEDEEDDSDIPTFGQTKKTIRTEAEKIAREIVQQTLAERDEADAPRRVRKEFSDFDEIVTKQNVDYLIENEPELAALLKNEKSEYRKSIGAYKYIKALKLNKDSVEAMKQDADRNMAKPVSPNAVGTRNSVGNANVFANGLTPDLKKQLHQEMIEAIRRR